MSDFAEDRISPQEFWEKSKTIPIEALQHVNILYLIASVEVLSEGLESLGKRVEKLEARRS